MKKGYALILVIIVISILLTLGALLTRIVYNSYSSTYARLIKEQAFFLAQAGLAKAEVELTKNPGWQTDLPSYQADDFDWLLNQAAGQTSQLGKGKFKLVRVQGLNRVYSLGFQGKGVVVLRQTFSMNPFTLIEWQEI